MNNPLLLSKAIYYASTAHLKDVDRADMPYILHPLRVMEAVLTALPDDTEAACAAVLHDVKEDHPTFWQLWHKMLTPRIEALVDNLSRTSDVDYDLYIDGIAASRNIPLIVIKIADLKDNISRPCDEKVWKLQQVAKYNRALQTLEAALLKEQAA